MDELDRIFPEPPREIAELLRQTTPWSISDTEVVVEWLDQGPQRALLRADANRERRGRAPVTEHSLDLFFAMLLARQLLQPLPRHRLEPNFISWWTIWVRVSERVEEWLEERGPDLLSVTVSRSFVGPPGRMQFTHAVFASGLDALLGLRIRRRVRDVEPPLLSRESELRRFQDSLSAAMAIERMRQMMETMHH